MISKIMQGNLMSDKLRSRKQFDELFRDSNFEKYKETEILFTNIGRK